jgi:hypothetical protein
MRLRTLDGEVVRGKLTAEYPVSTDGAPVLVVNGEPYGPEDAEFYLESATRAELKQLAEGGYDLPQWSDHEEDDEYMDDGLQDRESSEEMQDLESEDGESENY